MWEVEVAVTDPKTSEMHHFFSSGVDGEKFEDRDSAIKYGGLEIRKFYKTSWSKSVELTPIGAATVYTDGAGVIGFVNVWKGE